MNLQEMAKEVHGNAVAHGWWEEERSEAEVRALIHSEWSEALEEARADRPMVWHECMDAGQEHHPMICEQCPDCCCKKDAPEHECKAYNPKPEGIAVELIDGVIRILDLLGKENFSFDDEDWELNGLKRLCGAAECENETGLVGFPVAEVVDCLHWLTATDVISPCHENYMIAIGVVFTWIRAQSLCPEEMLARKHQYNKTRPYKHGKKF